MPRAPISAPPPCERDGKGPWAGGCCWLLPLEPEGPGAWGKVLARLSLWEPGEGSSLEGWWEDKRKRKLS